MALSFITYSSHHHRRLAVVVFPVVPTEEQTACWLWRVYALFFDSLWHHYCSSVLTILSYHFENLLQHFILEVGWHFRSFVWNAESGTPWSRVWWGAGIGDSFRNDANLSRVWLSTRFSPTATTWRKTLRSWKRARLIHTQTNILFAVSEEEWSQ